MSALREFQHDFAEALLARNTAASAGFGTGFAVYRNTVAKGMVDVLRANFPTVVRLVGDEWFDAVALRYVREQPPAQPALALYGAEFPAFLAAAVRQLPYLSAVATLDRLWTETHFAADASPLQAQQLASLSAEQLGEQTLQLHPAVRFVRCAHSAVTIWRAHRPPAMPPDELAIEDTEEAVLITRPHGQVLVEPLSMAGYEFLMQVQAGATLGAAAGALLAEDATTDVATLLAKLLQAGAFCGMNVITDEGEETLS